ncbi:disease resistance protein RPP8-like [Hevea brasiliensis]|uniref:disease resistance protein RPP8-like n=1 Tax=Hevea brasiliensis TaxID=3981 RepID=UPI0025CE992C|nr:disease resistance protein RPP8-like [Hevea brasiliensis]
MARQIVLSVLGKIANLLVQESDSLLGVEDQIHCIETELRRKVDRCDNLIGRRGFVETIYDLEDVIDELIIKSAQRSNRDASFLYVLAFVHLPMCFFYILALVDLLDHYRLRKRVEQIKINIEAYNAFLKSGLWYDSFGLYEVGVGYSVISPVIGLFEALATRNELRPTVRRQARRLRDEFKSLQDFLKDIEQSKELSEAGMAWMEELCDVCRSAENFVGLFLQRMKNEKRGPLQNLAWAPQNFISQHKLFQQMARINDKIRDISNRRHGAIPSLVPWSDYENLYQQEEPPPRDSDQLDMVSFDEDVDAVMAQLLKDDPRCITISIVGVGGIGKTCLAKLIYDSQAIADHFPYRIWVSEESEVEIMKKILGFDDSSGLYYDHGNETKESYAFRLRQMVNAFFADKKYLIVVNNSYPSQFWRVMGSAFSEISNGTRILFSVRRLNWAPPVTDTNLIYRLHLRSDDESWALFKHELNISIASKLESNLKEIILRKCGGLPKVIVKLGELVSQRDPTPEELSRMLDQLNQNEEPWSEVLEDINKYLPLYLRRCLFYFGLFPPDYKIPARRLIGLWVAEGLGRQQGDEKTPEYVVEECLRELVNHNMVQVTQKKLNGEIKTCRLPEAVRVHWFAKAKQANFLQGHTNVTSVIRRLADHVDPNDAIFDHIHGNDTASLYPCYSDVVSFLSFDTREGSIAGEDIGKFLDRCISSNCFHFLWVLDLENVYKPKLPKAIGQLTRLRYLSLRSTYLEILPEFIDKLINLQTLDLKRAHICTLPNIIWNMLKLRHLFLDESFRSTFVWEGGSSPMDLQTLWGIFVDEDSLVRNGLDTLLTITKLGLICKISRPFQKTAMSKQLDVVANWVQNLKNLRSLMLKSFDELNQPWDLHLESLSSHVDLTSIYLTGKLKNQHLVSEFPQNLVELTLSASGLAEDPMQILDKLPNLQILILMSKSFTGKKMFCSFGGFPKLEVLKFKKLEPLEEWNVEKGALPSLKSLEIDECRNLNMLPDGLRHVRTLRELKVTKLPVLSSRIKGNQGEDWNKIAHGCHVLIED